MNYRHIFHAGNFADLVKHAILLRLLARLTARAAPPLTVIDTHAGAGTYDLEAADSRRTGEAQAGIAVLMADTAPPAPLAALRGAVARLNPGGALRLYPGSPVLTAAALRPGDRLIACEMRAEDHAALARALAGRRGSSAVLGDGWAEAARRPREGGRRLVLIDPPFERADDYAQVIALLETLLARDPAVVVAVWVPIKDLATWDAFLGEVEDAAGGRPVLACQARLRPLDDPMRMNGCALLVVNPPPGLEAEARAVVEWVARRLGEAGARGLAEVFGGRG